MKRLSIIFEGILGDIAKRDLSGEKKKEDKITSYDKKMIDCLLKNFAHEVVFYSSYFYDVEPLCLYIMDVTSNDISDDYGTDIYNYLNNLTDDYREMLKNYVQDNYTNEIHPVLDKYMKREEEDYDENA